MEYVNKIIVLLQTLSVDISVLGNIFNDEEERLLKEVYEMLKKKMN